MGNKAPIVLPSNEWVDLNDVLEGGLQSGTTYILQATAPVRVFAGTAAPTERQAGFKIAGNEKFGFTATDGLFIKTMYAKTYLNVAD